MFIFDGEREPPCKAAAPVYAKMSQEYDEASCIFTKFNVDEVRELGSMLGISAMPTFKLFKANTEVGSCHRHISSTHPIEDRRPWMPAQVAVQRGWSESKVRDMLEVNGAMKGKND